MDPQSQQNIIELLFLSLYQDDHLSIDEDSMLQKALTALGWKEGSDDGPSVSKAFAAVRKANNSRQTRRRFWRKEPGSSRKPGTPSRPSNGWARCWPRMASIRASPASSKKPGNFSFRRSRGPWKGSATSVSSESIPFGLRLRQEIAG